MVWPGRSKRLQFSAVKSRLAWFELPRDSISPLCGRREENYSLRTNILIQKIENPKSVCSHRTADSVGGRRSRFRSPILSVDHTVHIADH